MLKIKAGDRFQEFSVKLLEINCVGEILMKIHFCQFVKRRRYERAE
jgi:hypothetical protein